MVNSIEPLIDQIESVIDLHREVTEVVLGDQCSEFVLERITERTRRLVREAALTGDVVDASLVDHDLWPQG